MRDLLRHLSSMLGTSIGKFTHTLAPDGQFSSVITYGRLRIAFTSSTSLSCAGFFQGTCCATLITTSHISQRKLPGSSTSFSPCLARFRGKRLSIFRAAAVGDNTLDG